MHLWQPYDIPGLEAILVNPFWYLALPSSPEHCRTLAGEATQGEEVSLGNSILDGSAVTFCDHGYEFGHDPTGLLQLVIAPFLL
jgi:hypothetical protein